LRYEIAATVITNRRILMKIMNFGKKVVFSVMTLAAIVGGVFTSFAAISVGEWTQDEEQKWSFIDGEGDAVTNDWVHYQDNYYYLDDDGYLVYNSLVDGDDIYYVNEAGARVSSEWHYLEDEDDGEYYWYWFGVNGKAAVDTERTINGEKYVFDIDGKMLDGWVSVGTPSVASISVADKYYEPEEGYLVTGWRYIEDENDGDYYWYYFKKGVPYCEGNTVEIGPHVGVAKINGKYYAFDADGHMIYGAYYGYNGLYYFGDESDGAMKTGRVDVDDSDYFDATIAYFEDSGSVDDLKGVGVTGVENGYLYLDGLIVKSEEGYQIKEVNGKYYVVNANGKVKTSGTVKDYDTDEKIKIEKDANGDYVITFVESGDVVGVTTPAPASVATHIPTGSVAVSAGAPASGR